MLFKKPQIPFKDKAVLDQNAPQRLFF